MKGALVMTRKRYSAEENIPVLWLCLIKNKNIYHFQKK